MKVTTLLESNIFKNQNQAAKYFNVFPQGIVSWKKYNDGHVPLKYLLKMHRDPNIDYNVDSDNEWPPLP